MSFIKIKNFYSLKDTVKRMERQTTDREKIFANHLSEKNLYSDYIKVLRIH